MQFINQYSFLLTALATLLILGFLLLRDGVRSADLVALGALLLGFTFAFLLLRPSASTFTQAEEVLDQLGAGSPVLVEFQSPY